MTTETDRELLEWAAKAAGIKIVGLVEKFIVQFDERHKGGFIVRNDRGGDSCWNPRTDDGDALRLAVKRNVFFNPLFAHYLALERFAQQDADDTKAYRRAIVRTVADEGKAMP